MRGFLKMVRANPITLLRKEREYYLILEKLINYDLGITYKHLGKELKDSEIEYLRDKIKLLIDDGFINELGVYNKRLFIDKDKKDFIKELIANNKKALKVFDDEKLKNVAIEREKDRKKINTTSLNIKEKDIRTEDLF